MTIDRVSVVYTRHTYSDCVVMICHRTPRGNHNLSETICVQTMLSAARNLLTDQSTPFIRIDHVILTYRQRPKFKN